MKRILLILVAVLSAVFNVHGQDLLRFSERDQSGTARYVGLAGAMTAVGGDPSAVLDNPAGLGIYRKVEVSFTFNEMLDYTRQNGTGNRQDFRSAFMLPQTSLIIALGANNAYNKLKFCNFMLSFNRLKTFNRTSYASAASYGSVVDIAVEQADGLNWSRMNTRTGWNDPAVGWLSLLSYGAYLMDPDEHCWPDTTHWKRADIVQPTRYGVRIDESGYLDEFNLNWAGNIDNRLYIGAGLAVRMLSYAKAYTYTEDYRLNRGADLCANLSQTGVGVHGSVGVMYHPVKMLRLGLSFHTPAIMTVTTKTNGWMNQVTETGARIDTTYMASEYYSATHRLSLPLRTTVGAAVLFGHGGLLSVEYDYRHWKNTEDVHTLKFGAEAVLVNNLFMDFGYACESSFRKSEPIYPLDATSVRIDSDFRNIGTTHFAGFGIGYRGNFFIAQLGYQFRYQPFRLYPCAGTEYADMLSMTHRIVFSFAWHTK